VVDGRLGHDQIKRGIGQWELLRRRDLEGGVPTGDIRDDIAADELAGYCLHALAAAATLESEAAVRRLVAVTLAGLQPR
jgi:hypothetical protein